MLLSTFRCWPKILLPLGLFLSTATRLRFPGMPFGISEILLLGALLINWPIILQALENWTSHKLLYIFWGIFFLFGIVGLYSFNPSQIVHVGVEKDIFAYGYVCLLSILFLNSFEQNENTLKTLIILYLLSSALFISIDTTLKTKFFYPYARFLGLSLNPNQLALALSPFPFVCLHYLFKNNISKQEKILWSLGILSSFYIGLKNASISLCIGWVIFGIGGIVFKIFYKNPGKILIFTSVSILCTSYSTFAYLKEIWPGVIGEFDIRKHLLWNILQALQKTHGLGSGFGSLVLYNGQAYESHNTLLNICLNSSIISGAIAVVLIFQALRNIFRAGNIFIGLAFLNLLFFSFAHSVMRHPILWFYLIVLCQMSSHSPHQLRQ